MMADLTGYEGLIEEANRWARENMDDEDFADIVGRLSAALQSALARNEEHGVVGEIAAERRHQVDDNGWSAEHDDVVNAERQLATAAYCILGRWDDARMFKSRFFDEAPARWPWDPAIFKTKGYRQDLVRVCAMLVAEIERHDRARALTSTGKEKTDD